MDQLFNAGWLFDPKSKKSTYSSIPEEGTQPKIALEKG